MKKHTPGPWRWDLRYCGLRGPDGRSVLVTDGMGIPDYSPESEANARLISASPDLLEALNTFAKHFGPLEDNEMLHPDARKCFELARAAIAKATGGEA